MMRVGQSGSSCTIVQNPCGCKQRPWLRGKSSMSVCTCLGWVPIFSISRSRYEVRTTKYRGSSKVNTCCVTSGCSRGHEPNSSNCISSNPTSQYHSPSHSAVRPNSWTTRLTLQDTTTAAKSKATTCLLALPLQPWVKGGIMPYSLLSSASYHGLWHISGAQYIAFNYWMNRCGPR